MSKERKPSTVITLTMKLNVLRDYLNAPEMQKSELAKIHGISATSVSRILNNRQELIAMSGLTPEEQFQLMTEKLPAKKKRPAVKERSKKSQTPVPNVTVTNMTQQNLGYQPLCEDSQHTYDSMYPESPYEDPEMSFERALKQLEDYTVELMACDLLTRATDDDSTPPVERGLFNDLYEFYEELLQNEFTMVNYAY